MKKAVCILLFVLVAAASFVAGGRFTPPARLATAPVAAPAILYYACPMHPQMRAARPGDCAACGMRLTAVYKNQGTAPGPAAPRVPAGSIHISADRWQTTGLTVAAVKWAPRAWTLRTTGRVAIDEARAYRIISGMQGRIIRVLPGSTGDVVKKGQLLALTSYLPDFLIAQQTFISALNTADRYSEAEAAAKKAVSSSTTPAAAQAPRQPGDGRGAAGRWRASADSGFADYIRTGAQVKTTRETLLTMGMGEAQVEEMARTRKLVDSIEIRAPADSVILARNLYPEQKFERGVEFYRLADLSHVWIQADVNGEDGASLRPGKLVYISIPNQKRRFRARVSQAVPQFDEAAHILRVRLEASNPGYALKPGMFVDVQAPMRGAPSLVIPADAVLDTGLRKTIFVERGSGSFEPRVVETGWRSADRVEVKRGLRRGERIVVSGTFLLDSESRMRQAGAEPPARPRHNASKRM